MIIELHKSILSKMKDGGLSHDEMSQLSSIFRLRRIGKTFILADIKELNMLEQRDLAPYNFRMISVLLSDQIKWKNWLKSLDFKIVITLFSDEDNSKLSESNNLPYISLLSYDCASPTVIAENINDVKFFISMTRSYLSKQLKIRGVGVKALEKLGGGSTISQVINNHQTNNEGAAFCIIDSDKRFPTADYGETAKKVISDVESCSLTKIMFTRSREIENIIPFDLMLNVLQSKLQIDKVNEYRELRDLEGIGDNPIKYVDFKKGLKQCCASKLVCKEHSDYWNLVFNKFDVKCECVCIKFSSCTCVVIDGFGTDLLKNIVAYLEIHPFDISQVDEYYKDELFEICKAMVPFVASPLAIAS
jgi:hypothetical protein